MTGEVPIVLSFLIFLAFFGWLGWRRGSRRELIVFVVALVGWLLLETQGSIFVNIANLAGAAFTFASSGGFTGSQEEAFAALVNAPQLVTEETQLTFLYGLWLGAFAGTYILTNLVVEDKTSPRNGWAVLLGMLNGLFFAVAFLPSLVTIFAPEGTVPEGEEFSLMNLLGGGLRVLWEGMSSLWTIVGSLGSFGLLVLLTLLLVVAATSIRGGARAKS